MKQYSIIVAVLLLHMGVKTQAQTLEEDVAPLLKSSCIRCHDADTKTRLNFEKLSFDLSDPATFRQWEKVFDRARKGEMPPPPRKRPPEKLLQAALRSLKKQLQASSAAAQQKQGRAPSRRLTRLEHSYTLRDLLLIEEDLSTLLPEESDSGSFDTIGSTQRISAVHVRGYLKAADQALHLAIDLGKRPKSRRHRVDYLKSPYVNRWYDIPVNQGGNVIKKLDDAVALFVDLDYLLRSDACGFHVRAPGWYRLTAKAYAYEAKTPVTLKLILASEKRGGAELLEAFDILPGQSRTVQVTAFLKPGDYFYPSVADLPPPGALYFVGAKKYKGEGIAVKSVLVEGPLVDSWPPPGTKQLLSEVMDSKAKDGRFELALKKEPDKHVEDIIRRMAPLAFRRPATEKEVASFVQLAEPALREGRSLTDAIRLPLRSLLSSPQFLFFGGKPGELDDFALASRLSYFLWKSMPDETLFQLAKAGRLSEPKVLAQQVDRMLEDEKSQRFVQDFLGQWLHLYDIHATTPDEGLYPEHDDVLSSSLVKETELFFTELVKKNLSVSHLIDSDFTFLNRRLAEHYGIQGVKGQHFRKVELPEESPRGGVLTQASVLKVTANGTVTSPVTRGNFVLTNLMGTPPNPPPPNVGSIEPDTRGKTTIREILAAHRNVKACAKCHSKIDPPGFALESFDPIGGYRARYRASHGRKQPFQSILRMKLYRDGPKVDSSGVTSDGKRFSGIRDFKKLLLQKKDQVARHFISQLVVYATGAEIQFADRELLDAIVEQVRKQDYPVRAILHRVVQSRLFRNK